MRWITEAKKHLGLSEIAGPKHNPTIVNWLIKLGAWWRDDETPWCGVFVAAVFKECGIENPKAFYRAKAWADWGAPLTVPILGCVVVLGRDGGGHVGFVVGKTPDGQLLILGGNQGNKVSVRAFDTSRVLAYRWPIGEPRQGGALPVMAQYRASEGEA